MSIALKLLIGLPFLILQCLIVLFVIGFFIDGNKCFEIIGSVIWIMSAITVFVALIALDPPKLTAILVGTIILNITSNIICFGHVVDDSLDHILMVGWGVMIILSFIDSSKHRDYGKISNGSDGTQ